MPSGALQLEHAGVEGLRVGRFDLGINTSCILYRIGNTLIDTGPPNQWPRVRSFLGERDIERVILTHYHEDHSGNGARIRRDMGATVCAPAQGTAPLRDGFPLRFYQRLLWGVPDRFEAEALPPQLSVGADIHLEPVATPGHSPDSTCFLEPNRGWLFTGDLYIASKPRFLRSDESVGDQIESLRRVLELEFDTLFCAHRGVLGDGHALLQRKRDYLMSLRDEVRALHAAGYSVRQITHTLLGREGFMSALSQFDFSKRNLVRGCLNAEP